MDANLLLSQMSVPTPCDMNWDSMRGDDRVRHCASCGKHVYNFTSMSPDEATSLLKAQEPEICGRLFERPDGTLVMSECQSGAPLAPRPWQFHIRSFMGVIAGFATALGIARALAVAEPPPPAKRTTAGSGRMIMGALRRDRFQAPPSVNNASCAQPE
jgi:hypothetical protein